jgi:hypothetical protein
MKRNKTLTASRRDDTGSGTSFDTLDPGPNRNAVGDEYPSQSGRSEERWTNDEPRLPKNYRHIRGAIEAVLECSGAHASS